MKKRENPMRPPRYHPNSALIKSFSKIILLLTFASVVSSRPGKDKSILFEKYPQLNSPKIDPCISGLNKFLISYLQYPYTKMNEYSFH